MREILFHGKRKTNGKWICGDYFRSKISNTELGIRVIHSITFFQNGEEYSYAIDPDTLGQYTSLTANGKKIFEGDIIGANYEGAVGVVRFGEYMSPSDPDFTRNIGYYVDWQGKEKDFLRADLGYWASRSDVKVIGNIHDNPELLEDKS